VVDPSGECWDVAGLYVADASAFPTASGVNPMITAMVRCLNSPWGGSGRGGLGFRVAQGLHAAGAAQLRSSYLDSQLTHHAPPPPSPLTPPPTPTPTHQAISHMISLGIAQRITAASKALRAGAKGPTPGRAAVNVTMGAGSGGASEESAEEDTDLVRDVERERNGQPDALKW